MTLNSKYETSTNTLSSVSVNLSKWQKLVDQDWNGFSQTIDVSAYQGGQFRFKGFVKAENANKLSNARLWARVDSKKRMTFLDNMFDRPILSNEWKEYIIEGPIGKNAIQIIIGGLFFGNAKYYFDKFSLEIKKRDSIWEKLKIANDGFEDEAISTYWKSIYNVKGYELQQISEKVYEGSRALIIDASSRPSRGKFIEVNGISIYYETGNRQLKKKLWYPYCSVSFNKPFV